MPQRRRLRLCCLSIAFACVASVAFGQATATQKPFEPSVGQAGKDVVWVPTSEALVQKMLDMAKVTPQDVVMDLGSGDGRTVIAAAKRGARAIGIEYEPDMVELSKRNAAAAGLSPAKATFMKADLFETDLSQASVITMFLLPSINLRLRPTILDLKPGTRIVANTFDMAEWEPDEKESIEGDCVSWCTALLWIVPAKVDGTWTTRQGDLKLTQQFQVVSGTLGTTAISEGRLRGDGITFTAGGVRYEGRVNGTSMQGTAGGSKWSATRAQ